MSDHVRAFQELLQEQLGRAIDSENDFVSLASTGESLRRMLAASDLADDDPAHETLGAYDRALAAYAGPVPTGLDADLRDALAALQAIADTPASARDDQESRDALEGVDQVLCVATAAWRAGQLSDAELASLSATASEQVAGAAAFVPELWNFAADWQAVHGVSSDSQDWYAFWEQLSSLSDQEYALRHGPVFTEEQRHRLVNLAVDILSREEASEVPADVSCGEVIVLSGLWVKRLAKPGRRASGAIRFQAPAGTTMAVAADSEPQVFPDPPKEHSVILVDDERVHVRLAEGWLTESPESVGALVIRLKGQTTVDLTAEGAMRMTGADGRDVQLLRKTSLPGRLLAVFSARGKLTLAIPALALECSFAIERETARD